MIAISFKKSRAKEIVKALNILYFSIFCIFSCFNQIGYADNEGGPWTLSKKTEIITVYRMAIPGLDIDAFKGVCEYPVRLEVLGSVLENISGYVSWIDSLIESRIIKKIDKNHLFLYQRYEAVWPFSDRDCVAEVNVDRNFQTGQFTIRIHSISGLLPPLTDGTVRLPAYEGTFLIEYIDREHTRITYIGKIEFGGNIPNWLGDFLSSEIPFITLNGLIQEAQKKKYIKIAETSELKRKLEESVQKGILKP